MVGTTRIRRREYTHRHRLRPAATSTTIGTPTAVQPLPIVIPRGKTTAIGRRARTYNIIIIIIVVQHRYYCGNRAIRLLLHRAVGTGSAPLLGRTVIAVTLYNGDDAPVHWYTVRVGRSARIAILSVVFVVIIVVVVFIVAIFRLRCGGSIDRSSSC